MALSLRARAAWCGWRARGALHLLLLCLAMAVAGAESVSADTVRSPLGVGEAAALFDGRELFLEAIPRRGEGWLSLAGRFCGNTGLAPALRELNGGRSMLLRGVRYRIPFALLLPEYQLEVARALFQEDQAEADGWIHRIAPAGGRGRESLWHVAEWFTGRGENYVLIRSQNELADDNLEPGQELLIPARLLRPAFRSALPPSSPYFLQYEKGRDGSYAIYRLKPGEALYSSVVIRFTGRIYAEDVNSLAGEVAAASGIRDVTDIPVGYPVRIPIDLLLPEFLPAGDPRRREYEEGLTASAQYSNPVTASRLQGVTVILDAGHGGADVGASVGGTWESLYVYDVMVRAKRLLESWTSAQVVATTGDGDGFKVTDRGRLPYSRGHRVLTDPPYPIEDSTVGVHLRWYLANSVFRRVVKDGGDEAKVVFLSIHADSLHPSLRGAMAYIPGARWRGGSYGKSGAIYAARREVREEPSVSFASKQLVKSEGLSRNLAQYVLGAFRERDLVIHADKPIREKVIRSRRAWVPAVLRYNSVPASALIEICNLANADDRRLLETVEFREQVAEALVDGVLRYYGDSQVPSPGLRVAATAR